MHYYLINVYKTKWYLGCEQNKTINWRKHNVMVPCIKHNSLNKTENMAIKISSNLSKKCKIKGKWKRKYFYQSYATKFEENGANLK